eukprot:439893_1
MGNNVSQHASKCNPSNDDSTAEMFGKLINMGYDEDLSIMAAQRFPKNINKAIDLIQRIKQKLKHHNNKNNINDDNKDDDDDDYIQNLLFNSIAILQAFATNLKKNINNENDQNNKHNKSKKQKQTEYETKLNDNNHARTANTINYKRIDECSSVQRVINMLEWYQKYKTMNCEDDNIFSEFLCSLKTNHEQIVNDFHHILNNYLNEDTVLKQESDDNFEYIYNEIIKRENMKCDINDCSIFARNDREREKEKTAKQRQKEKEMISVYFLDSIHCYFCHSVDVGYRLMDKQILFEMQKQQKNIKHDNIENICYDPYLFILQAKLKEKQDKLQKVTQNRMKNNKFMTLMGLGSNEIKEEIQEQKSNEEHDKENEEEPENKKDVFYSFGQWKNYWRKDIKPKYSNIKEEVLKNEIYHICQSAYDEAYNKAIFLLNNSQNLKRTKSEIGSHRHGSHRFGVESGEGLGINNILSLIFYTDYTVLSFHFSSTFRKLSKTENYDQYNNKQRNAEYWHWSKTLIETVNYWGTKIKNTKINSFYHGISNMYFNKFITAFMSPTSTTTKLAVATRFAKKTGIILEVHQGNHSLFSPYLRYFNCSFISGFANEDERLFIQPPRRSFTLQIKNIRNVGANETYKDHIKAIITLENIFSPNFLIKESVNISPKVVLSINNIIEMVTDNDQSDILPQYIKKSILKWVNIARQLIVIDMKELMETGKELNIWDKQNPKVLKFDVIIKLMRNVQAINCTDTGNVDSEYLCSMISVFKAINNIKYSKLANIQMFGINMKCWKRELNEYDSLLGKENWRMDASQHTLFFNRL